MGRKQPKFFVTPVQCRQAGNALLQPEDAAKKYYVDDSLICQQCTSSCQSTMSFQISYQNRGGFHSAHNH